MNIRTKRGLLLTLCFLIFIGPFTILAGGGEAFAKVSRVAIATKVSGTVSVLKSGGAKAFKGFKNMTLNEGDLIRTGKDGSVVLELASDVADKDTVTVGANSEVSFTKLKDESGTKTKLSVWAGSLWVKVKSVSNADDRFEVETPTSIMGVRGTHFFVTVRPYTGLTEVFLAAGIIESTAAKNFWNADVTLRFGKSTMIYPTQQIVQQIIPEGVRTNTAIVDMNQLVKDSDPLLIASILSDAASIRAEQEQMLTKWNNQLTANGQQPINNFVQSIEDLNRVTTNMYNLLSIMAREAVAQQKLDLEQVKQISGDQNELAGKTVLDLDTKSELTLTKENQQSAVDTDKIRNQDDQTINEAKKKQEEEKKNLDSLIQKLQEQQQQQEEANQKALEQLTQLAEQAANSQNSQNSSTPPTSSEGTVSPKVSLAFNSSYTNNKVILNGSYPIDLNVQMSGFNANKIYGYQIEIEYASNVVDFNSKTYATAPYTAIRKTSPFLIEPEGEIVSGALGVDQVKTVNAGTGTKSLIYSAAFIQPGTGVLIQPETTVVRLPFTATHVGTAAFRIKSLKVFDVNGKVIEAEAGKSLSLDVYIP